MSKGLEALKSMWLYIDEPTKRQFALQDYKIIEKELKAIEIIKNKDCLFKGLQDLTQEEYDLLKEVLL